MVRGLLLSALVALVPLRIAHAHEGHDHAAAPPVTTQPLAPRFEASSSEFALLGILEGSQIVLYLERYATNEPIAGATIELESGGYKVRATTQADGTYRAHAGPLAAPGQHALMLSIETAEASDLLDAHLQIAAVLAPPAAQPLSGNSRSSFLWAFGGGAALLAAAIVGLARRKPAGAKA
jgi:hypothetical protein